MLRKVKNITILLAVAVLCAMLISLTGCVNNPVQTMQEGVESQNGTTPAQEQGDATTGETQQSNPEQSGLQVSSIIQGFDENCSEALVKLSNDSNFNVINTEGKVVYSFSDENLPSYASSSDMKYYNGYLLVNRESSTDDDKVISYVKDLRDGTTKIEGTDLIECVDITESGYVLQRVKVESLAGETYESRIVDINGNVIWKNEDHWSVTYFATIVGDFVAYLPDTYSNQNYIIINAKTGKTIDLGFHCVSNYFDCQVFGDYLLVGVSANNNNYSVIDLNNFKKINTGLSHVHKILNDKYVYATPLYGTIGIYTMEGKLSKDLTEGKVEDIFYYDNTYHVLSQTGYYYTLNDSFKYVKQPVKMLEDTYSTIRIGEYLTTFTTKNLTSYHIPTSQFDPSQDMTQTAQQGAVAYSHGNVGFIRNNNTLKLMNLETMQEIAITR